MFAVEMSMQIADRLLYAQYAVGFGARYQGSLTYGPADRSTADPGRFHGLIVCRSSAPFSRAQLVHPSSGSHIRWYPYGRRRAPVSPREETNNSISCFVCEVRVRVRVGVGVVVARILSRMLCNTISASDFGNRMGRTGSSPLSSRIFY